MTVADHFFRMLLYKTRTLLHVFCRVHVPLPLLWTWIVSTLKAREDVGLWPATFAPTMPFSFDLSPKGWMTFTPVWCCASISSESDAIKRPSPTRILSNLGVPSLRRQSCEEGCLCYLVVLATSSAINFMCAFGQLCVTFTTPSKAVEH